MKLRLGDLVECAEELRTILSGDVFAKGTQLAVYSTDVDPGGGRYYRLRPWSTDIATRNADSRRINIRPSQFALVKVIGTAFEVPKRMDEFTGRTVIIQQDIYIRGTRPAPRKPLVPVLIAKAGERMVVDGHYRGKLNLNYLPTDPRWTRNIAVVYGVSRYHFNVILEPK